MLVRHGRTAANAARKLQGHLDLPLDEVGLAQVTEVAEWLGRPDRVISSPLVRARQTADAFGLAYEVDDRWIELDYGDLDGQPLRDVPASVWQRWREDSTFVPGGGESMAELGLRVRGACEEIAEIRSDLVTIVVSHVSPIKAAVAWALGVDDTVTWRMHLDQASITRIRLGGAGPALLRFNDVHHLRGT